jgi:alpha-galactosidase
VTKIAFIGAGSTVFMKNLIGDALQMPALADATISLMDIDARRLAESELVAKKLIASLGVPARVETHSDQRRDCGGGFRDRGLPDWRLQALHGDRL